MAKRKAEMALTPKTPKRAEIPCLSGTLNKSPNTPKRIVLSIEEKRDVLKKFDTLPCSMSQEGASKMLQIPRMTLRNILKNREEEIMSAPNSAKKRCFVYCFHDGREETSPDDREKSQTTLPKKY